MNRKGITILVSILLCCSLMAGSGVLAISSNFAINWDLIAGGGGAANSANYTITGTAGQPATESSYSANYQLTSGYWYPVVTAANFAVKHDIISGGDGTSSSANYTVTGTIGQLATESSSTTNYQFTSGYWFQGDAATLRTQAVGTATGTGTAAFTTSDGCISDLTAVAQAALTCSSQTGLDFPHGFFSFNVTSISANSTVTIDISLPSAVPVGTQYWKCQDGTCVDVTSLLGDDDGDNMLTLTIRDGGLGDTDGISNGTIVNLGGPGFTMQAHIALTTEGSITTAKVGDNITYTVNITNTGNDLLVKDSIYDSVAGDISSYFSDNLTQGASDNASYTYTVTGTEPDPLINTVTAHYHPQGLPSHDISASDNWSIDLIIPSVSVIKTGNTISKVGDNVAYTISITNTGNVDLVADNITDSLLENITASFSNPLVVGGSDNISYSYTVKSGDADPLVNKVIAHYHAQELPDCDVSSYDIWSVNLVHPSISVTKTGNVTSKIGDNVTYTITITNTGDIAVVTDNITDSRLGNITSYFLSPLYPGATDSVDYTYGVQPGDPDPVENTVTAHYHPLLLTNDITSSDNCSVDLVHPGISVTKTSDPISKTGDNVTYTITVTNTGDDTLVKDSIIDSLVGNIGSYFLDNLTQGASDNVSYTYTVTGTEPDPIENTVIVHYHPQGLANDISDNATTSVDLVHPGILVTKLAHAGTYRSGDNITYTISISNTGDDTLVKDSIIDSLVGNISSYFSDNLTQGASDNISYIYTVKPDDPDPLVNIVSVHYHPQGLSNDISDNTTASVDLVPSITSVNPVQGNRGHTLNITIAGTHFNRATAVSFGAGITVNSFTVDSPTQITANISIAGDAALGPRDISVTNAEGTGSLTNCFTVDAAPPAQHVATATGTGTASFTSGSGSLTGLTAVAQSELTCPYKPGLTFLHGFFRFNITNIVPGSTATITIELPSAMPIGIQYWKCQNGTWVNMTSLLGDDDGDNILTLTVTDGGTGDTDGAANGTIVDPGGPAVISTLVPRALSSSPAPPYRPEPARITVKYLDINPQKAYANQPVSITTNVVNSGGVGGSYTVVLRINGRVEQTRTVSVGPGASCPVRFTVTEAQPETYAVDISGQRGRFTIVGSGGQGIGVKEGLIVATATFVLVLLLGLLLIVVRRRFQTQ